MLRAPSSTLWEAIHSHGRFKTPSVSPCCSPGADGSTPGRPDCPGPSPLPRLSPKRQKGSWQSLKMSPLPFLTQTFAFSVCWSDNSDSFARRSWDEFRQLQVRNTGVIFQSPLDTRSVDDLSPRTSLSACRRSSRDPSFPGDSLHFQSLTHASPHQKTLKKTFPVEAGLLRKSERVLPKLPG